MSDISGDVVDVVSGNDSLITRIGVVGGDGSVDPLPDSGDDNSSTGSGSTDTESESTSTSSGGGGSLSWIWLFAGLFLGARKLNRKAS